MPFCDSTHDIFTHPLVPGFFLLYHFLLADGLLVRLVVDVISVADQVFEHFRVAMVGFLVKQVARNHLEVLKQLFITARDLAGLLVAEGVVSVVLLLVHLLRAQL
jgi:hypothetical protein